MRIMNQLAGGHRGARQRRKISPDNFTFECGGGSGAGRSERKEGKRSALVISTRLFAVMTGLFPSAVCLRRHHGEDVSIFSSVTLARFSTVESDTSFGISLDDLRFPLGENRIVKKGSSKEG